MAETSFSDAARVDSPKGVQRKSAASAAATTITIPARQEAVDRDDAAEDHDGVGRKDRRRRLQAVAEDRRSSPPRSTSRRPSDAASFASGAVFRSGRKMVSSIRTPNAAMQASVRTNAGAVESWKPK